MNSKQYDLKTNKKRVPNGSIPLLFILILLFSAGSAIFIWYGTTFYSVYQKSNIPARQLEIRSGGQQCTLEIPSGVMTIRRPTRTAVGLNYHLDSEITLEQPMRFTNCVNGLPNWSISLEAQTTLVSSNVKPYPVMRQPAFDRDHFSYNWTFVPEETVPQYQSHLWLRVIVTQQDQTVENWNLLVRDFPMQNDALFGQTAFFWLISGAVCLVISLLLLIIFLQKNKRIFRQRK